VRAAALTRQLLAFSRKQVLRLEPTSLNEVVYGLTEMLARLLTEDISCTTQLEAGLSNVRADRAQLEQVIINLCVNAKDAMPHGGKLTIATRSFRIGASEAELIGVHPAEYVELAVTDNGTGMDEATRARIFEPFFTTKAVGHGTGLGLATVYGIITQSGGSITVESTPGAGSCFRVLLPAIHEQLALPSEATLDIETAGTGTVLVMEDEEQVRALFCRVLRRAGYQVLEASNGIDAASVSDQFPGTIDLVISDVIMPGMNGPEAVSRLIVRRPNMRVLYISGYTRDLALKKGLSDRRVNYLEKPVSPHLLRRAVHNLINAPEDVLAPDELIGTGERANS
jgi:CheY-like chemotaxis protein